MPFYLRYAANELAVTGTPTTTTIPCTSLTQPDNFWVGQWVLITSGTLAGQERRVTAFNSTGHTLTLEYPLASAPAVGVMFEITALWPPSLILEAITQAWDDGFRHFTDEVVDETMVLQQNVLEYSLTGLTYQVLRPLRLYVERSTNFTTRNIASAAAGTAVLTDTNLVTDQYNGYILSLYTGKGAGQWRTITATTAPSTLAITPVWTVTPDSTSKAVLRDPSYQAIDWYPITRARWNSSEKPTKMYLTKQMNALWGMRLRFIYEACQSTFLVDADTTTIPVQWLSPKSRAYMHEYMISDNRSDASRHLGLKQTLDQMAEQFHIDNPDRGMQPSMWFESGLEYPSPYFDPLDWGLGSERQGR